LKKYKHAERYISAQASVNSDYQLQGQRRSAQEIFLHDAISERAPVRCSPEDTIREAARRMNREGSSAIAVLEGDSRLAGIVTGDDIIRCVAQGESDWERPISTLMDRLPCTMGLSVKISDCVLAMAEADTDAAAITDDGS